MLPYLLLTVILLCVFHVLFNYNNVARAVRKIPGPTELFIICNALAFMVSPEKVMAVGRKYAKKFDGIYRIWCFPIGAIVIYNPEDIEIIMSTMKHSEKSLVYNILKPWLQDGLLLSKGEKWQTRRKILTPTFHFNILRQFSVILQENTQRLVKVLEATVERPADVVPVISDFTLSSICETAMGTQLNEHQTDTARSYKDAIYKIGNIFSNRFVRLYLMSDFVYSFTSLYRAQNNILKLIRKFTKKVIHERKTALSSTNMLNDVEENDAIDDVYMKKKKKIAMLDLLISAEKEGLIDSKGIQEEVDTFMFEGHDTTASGLTLCMMALANHKDIQAVNGLASRPGEADTLGCKGKDKAVNGLASRPGEADTLGCKGKDKDKAAAEVTALLGDSDRGLTIQDTNNLPYLDRCIKESLRMYPPVHFISRNLTEPVKLSNKYDLPAGLQCHISIFDLHHREDLYPNPSKFDPDRFLPEKCINRHPYAYIPFSAGPRNCIGQKFALLEMKLVLAEVLRRFELRPVTRPEDLHFIGDLVLRNIGPVYVTFAKRNSTTI